MRALLRPEPVEREVERRRGAEEPLSAKTRTPALNQTLQERRVPARAKPQQAPLGLAKVGERARHMLGRLKGRERRDLDRGAADD
jgi:hypothetical protein